MRFVLAALVGVLSSSTALAGHHVRPGEVVVVHSAPAPVVYVAHPRPPAVRPGFVWVDGYWAGPVYYPGHWERVRPAVAVNVAVGPVRVAVAR